MIIRLPRIALFTVIAVVFATGLLAADKAEKAAQKKAAAASSKLAGSMQKTFKLWDRNKDDAADKDELEKMYVKPAPKAKKKGAAPAAPALDPAAGVTALMTKADADSDGKISKAEFDSWAPQFGEYLSKYVELQTERARVAAELAKVEAIIARSGNVSALDGVLQTEMRRGVITYKQSLESIDGQLKELDAAGHGEYRDLLLPQLLR